MTSPEPLAPNATGLPRRSSTRRYRLSAHTTNIPGVEYIAATIVTFAGGRPIPLKASWATSPCTSAMSSRPASSSGTFSVLPLVFRCSTASVGAVSLTVSANAAPYTGKPPPGVAVPRTTTVFCAVDMADTLPRPRAGARWLEMHHRLPKGRSARPVVGARAPSGEVSGELLEREWSDAVVAPRRLAVPLGVVSPRGQEELDAVEPRGALHRRQRLQPVLHEPETGGRRARVDEFPKDRRLGLPHLLTEDVTRAQLEPLAREELARKATLLRRDDDGTRRPAGEAPELLHDAGVEAVVIEPVRFVGRDPLVADAIDRGGDVLAREPELGQQGSGPPAPEQVVRGRARQQRMDHQRHLPSALDQGAHAREALEEAGGRVRRDRRPEPPPGTPGCGEVLAHAVADDAVEVEGEDRGG